MENNRNKHSRNIKSGAIDFNNISSEESSEKFASRKKKINTKKLIISIVCIVAFVIAVGVGAYFLFFAAKEVTTLELTDNAAQYYLGETYKIEKGSKIFINEESDLMIEFPDESERDAGPIPVYYTGKQSIILTENVDYYAPRNDVLVRADRLTEITYNEYGAMQAINGKNAVDLKQGFFYNGKDIYIFTEPVTLKFNGYVIELGAMSYVEADSNNFISYYNTADGESFFEKANTDVIAEIPEGDYKVSLLGDNITYSSGFNELLFARPNDLQKTVFSK